VIDLVGQVGVEVAERVVGKRRQVDDRVEAGQVGRGDVAHVHPQRRHLRPVLAEPAPLEVERVEPDDIMPSLSQHRDHDRPDVPVVAGDQDSHVSSYGSAPLTHAGAHSILPPEPSRLSKRCDAVPAHADRCRAGAATTPGG
jgi:hypothetical protein